MLICLATISWCDWGQNCEERKFKMWLDCKRSPVGQGSKALCKIRGNYNLGIFVCTELSHLNKYIEDFLCASAILGDANVTQMVNTDKLILKCVWKCKWPRITTVILKNNNKTGGFTIRGQDVTKKPIHMQPCNLWEKNTINTIKWEIHILINGAMSTEYHI